MIQYRLQSAVTLPDRHGHPSENHAFLHVTGQSGKCSTVLDDDGVFVDLWAREE